MSRRVVITGLGTVNPLGNNATEFWQRVKEGKSGVKKITRFDASDFPSRIAGEIRDFDDSQIIESREARRMDLFSRYAIVATMEALSDCQINIDELDSFRTGVLLGVGFGGMDTLETEFKNLFTRGPKGVHPLLVPKMISNIAGGHIAIRLKAYGPSYTVISACASANDAIGESFRWIKDNGADVIFKDAGTEFGRVTNSSTDFIIQTAVSDKDFIIKGNDGGSTITPFTIDMSAGGDLFLTGGLIDLKNDGSAVSQIKFYCESSNAHAQTLIGAPHSESANNVLTLPGTGGDARLVSTASTATDATSPVVTTATSYPSRTSRAFPSLVGESAL